MGILITDTTLRDAHQSLIATRMRTRDMLPIAEKLDQVGFFSLEVWGGATFDACIRFLNEDPWDRLRALRKKVKNTRLQMLLRGQNIVGYRHYPDDVLREFIRLAVKNGVDVFRIFDALNDMRNMELAIRTAKEYKSHVQGAISYTISPVHTNEKFAEMAAALEGLGCDSICIKDMSGIISPAAATELVRSVKRRIRIPVNLHSHCASGMAPASYYAAALAGVDMIDTAFSAFGWGSSQPPTESMAAAFKDTPYDTGLDLKQLKEIGEYFAGVSAKYRFLFTAEATSPNIGVILHQIPGGMISNLVSQLREQKMVDRLGEVLEEVPRVRADLGYPPLVTPTSQIVGIQAVLNVLSGERYKQVTKETKEYLLGYYGRPPGKVNPEVRDAILGGEKPIDVRPAELLAPELEKVRAEGERMGIIHQEEDVVTYALYPAVAVKFLRGELKEEVLPSAVEAPPLAAGRMELPSEFSVDVDGEVFHVKISPVVGTSIEIEKPKKPRVVPDGAVVCPMQGMVLAIRAKVGAVVNAAEVVAVIESMKMQNEIRSPHSGIVKELLVFEGEVVRAGDVIMIVEANGR